MVLDLREIYEIPGKSLEFDYEIPQEETSYIKGVSFDTPVCVKGNIHNRNGIVTMELNVKYKLSLICDRCLKNFTREEFHIFKHGLIPSSPDEMREDDDVLITGNTLDLNDTVLSDVLLEMPTRNLCSEDCKGICPICGKNLNEGICDCPKSEISGLEKETVTLGSLIKGGVFDGSTEE